MQATEDIPYPAYIHRVTQIDHLATMLHLAGADAPDLGTARVLDLGCAYGTNLVPMALAYPDAEFLGLDIDEKAISEGKRFNRSLGLENVTLLATGDMRAAVAGRQFDYIIAHGLFSWVDDGVREEILNLIAETLAPGGVAYLSYNCYPGWLGAYAMRDLLSLSTAGLTGSARTGVLRGQFASMNRALEADPTKRPHAAQMLADLRSFQKMEDGHLAGELCAESCDPFYLTEFAEMAAGHGLDYLADAWPEKQFFESLPEEARACMAGFSEKPLLQLQMADFLVNQRFRASLLRKASAPPCRPVAETASAPLDLHYTIAVGVRDVAENGELATVTLVDGNALTVPVTCATFFRSLLENPGCSAPVPGGAGKDEFAALLRKLMSLGLLFPHLRPVDFTPLDRRSPCLSPLNRALAKHFGTVCCTTFLSGPIRFPKAAAMMDGNTPLEKISRLTRINPNELRAMVCKLAENGMPQWTGG